MSETTEAHYVTSLVANEVATAATHLATHLRGRLRDASVSIQRGGVVIRGTTTSFYIKQLALHAVMKRVSLPIAANEIEVQA